MLWTLLVNAQHPKRDTIIYNQFRDYVEWSKQQHKKTLEDFENEKYLTSSLWDSEDQLRERLKQERQNYASVKSMDTDPKNGTLRIFCLFDA